MSAPSTLSPWYVVFRESKVATEPHYSELLWYQSEYSDDKDENGLVYTFSPNKKGALILHNLASASRIAKAQPGGMIRALTTEAEAEEFDRA
jgi:hypothetical protein